MIIRITYLVLLSLMLVILWLSGRSLKYNFRFFSIAGISAIAVYTLNEGLRFGRGIDYNLYWRDYDRIMAGWESIKEPVFNALQMFFIWGGQPFQALVFFMSFMFILGTLFLMRNFRLVLPLALPLFVLYSLYDVENLIRWYLAFSIFLIGLSFLIKEKKFNWRFALFSVVACMCHYGFLVVPPLFYVIYLRKGALLHPLVSTVAFLAIYFLFDTSIMLNFSDWVNQVTTLTGLFTNYAERSRYWLTGGFAGNEMSGRIAIFDILFILTTNFLGYKTVSMMDRKYTYAYNLFIIGMLLLPISKKIELVGRFDQVFYIFRAIVVANIFYTLYIWNRLKVQTVILVVSFFIIFGSFRLFVLSPLRDNPRKYLYVWDHKNEDYTSIYDIFLNDLYKSSHKK